MKPEGKIDHFWRVNWKENNEMPESSILDAED